MYTFDKSNEMFLRATRLIPTGVAGNKNPIFSIPRAFPVFAERGEGCRYWDVDGNAYIDFLCGFGPIVLGYNYKKVDDAFDAQRRMGSAFNHPTERTVELAEKLVELIPSAEWATFGRNGSDVTTYAVQAAREKTQRRKVIIAKGAYHGSHAWCTPREGGIIEEDKRHVLTFTWNDATELEDLVSKHKGDVACVMLTPHHHPSFAEQALPAPGFWADVRHICDEHDIVLVCDDIRDGFRLSINGSAEYFGIQPDMTCFCKAMANGYTLSAIVGTDEIKTAAAKVFFTGTYYSAGAEIAASLATLEELEKQDAVDHMMKMGNMLCMGLTTLAENHGLQIKMTGPPTIPFLTFANERDFRRNQLFSKECACRGVLFHPHHNWFIMYAHKEKDIQQALDVADAAFAVVKREFGS
ncbi:MAG: aminotransferase class III-fold pyridoxal phosphate-dependent enzyme [Myxococcota bacterium]|nr:aminotransferase class III-fold pyridoxal phosphate-dependent enzyme [Myxococcota bacterium]